MNVLVLNMGLKSIRSIIFNDKGIKIADSSRTLTTAIDENKVEQFPEEWWKKGIEVMKASISDAMIDGVDYITVTTSAACLVCVDKDGNALSNAIMVSDKRAVEEASKIRKLKEYKIVEDKSGLEMSASLMLPKILWVKNNDKEVFDKTSYFVTPNDYLIYHLSGRIITDELNAIKYHYTTSDKSYPSELLKAIGIPNNKLPMVASTGSYVGDILPVVAQEIGCKTNAKIVITSYDAICSFVGSGVLNDGEASDVSGTVTVFRMLSKKKQFLPSNKVYVTPFKQGNYHIVGGSNNLGGGLIEWVKQCYYSKEEYPYEVMEKEASESEIGARGLIFLPYLLGERAPIWNDSARGAFFGLERMHTRKDMTRAVFESAAFIDRTMMEAIGEMTDDVKTIRLSGGLARVNLISQIKADVTGKPVSVLSEFETTSSGAAMMVLNGQEGRSFEELSKLFSQIRMTIYPDINNHKKYDVMYTLFRETYQTLEPLYDRRIKLLDNIRSVGETQIENL